MAAEDINLDEEPEEVVAGQMAQAIDELRNVEKRLGSANNRHTKADKHLLSLHEQLENSTSLDDTEQNELEKTAGRSQGRA